MFATIAELKLILGITDTSKDALLTLLLTNASAYIKSETGRAFEEVENFTENIDGSGTRELILTGENITDTTDFLLESRTDVTNEDNFETVDATTYFVDEENGIIKGLFTFVERFEFYRVTYSYGYTEVPADIKQACLTIAQSLYQTSSGGAGGNAQSEKVGEYSITYKSVQEVAQAQESVQKILFNYSIIEL